MKRDVSDSRGQINDVRKRAKIRNKKVMSFGRNVCNEEIWRLPESPKTQKNLPEFHQQELATLLTGLKSNDIPLYREIVI